MSSKYWEGIKENADELFIELQSTTIICFMNAVVHHVVFRK